MKKLFALLVLPLFLFSCNGNRKPKNHNASADTPTATIKTNNDTATPKADTLKTATNPIAAIRQKVEAINTSKLEQKHFEFQCDEKMKVDYFYTGGAIVKISVDYGTIGDVYAREDYYYDAGKLIFNYEFVEGGPACEGCIKKNEYRSYISNNKVIKYLKDRNTAQCRKCEFGPSAKQYKLLKVNNKEQIKAALCR